MHLFMRMFFLNGRATLHKEVHGDKYNAPLDIYNHLLEEYLLRFFQPNSYRAEDNSLSLS